MRMSGSDEELPAVEKRRAERFHLDLTAFVTASGRKSVTEPPAVTARDVSMSGAFFLTPSPLPIGTRVDVDMILNVGDDCVSGTRKTWIKASGAVQRVDPLGMAVRFDNDSTILPFSTGLPRPKG